MAHPTHPITPEGAPMLERVRSLCLALPETFEKEAWGMPTFRVGNEKKNRMFAMFSDNHHDDGRVALLCFSEAEDRRVLLESEPDTYYIPPYSGARGWVGVILERADDTALAEAVEDAYRRVAPQRLLAELPMRE